MDNEDLNVYKKDNPKEDNQTTHGTVNHNHKSPLFTGKRLNGRRIALKFITKNEKVIHADLNA